MSSRLPALCAALAVALSAPAQSRWGDGCSCDTGHSLIAPTVVFFGSSHIGGSYRVEVRGLDLPDTRAAWMWTGTRQSWVVIDPYLLGGTLGCAAYTLPVLVTSLRLEDPALRVVVPSDPALVGVQVLHQGIAQVAASAADVWCLSAAVIVTIRDAP